MSLDLPTNGGQRQVGFLPLKVHFADEKESKKHGWPPEILVIDEWLLLEYAVCFLPANQDAPVESVSKAGLDLPADFLHVMGVDPALIVPKHTPPAAVPFTPLAEIEKAVQEPLAATDVETLVRKTVEEVYDRSHGRD